MNYEILENYILSAVDRNEFTVKAEESGCSIRSRHMHCRSRDMKHTA